MHNVILLKSLAIYYDIVARDKHVCHSEESEDQDWKMWQYYLLSIVAATEPFTDIENLWKTSKSKKNHNNPDS
jgi:hypothetical protein